MSEPIRTPAGDDDSLTLRDLWRAVRRHRSLLLGTAAGVLALTMAATFLLPPSYEGDAAVRIRADDPSSSMLGDLAPLAKLGGLGSLAEDDVDTEIGVLRSRRIVAAAAEATALHVDLKLSRRPRTEVLDVIHAGPDAVRADYTLTHEGDGTYSVRVSRARGEVSPPARVRIGEPFELGNMTLAIRPGRDGEPPSTVRFGVASFDRTVRKVRRSRLKVDRQQSGSQLVQVRFRHGDPRIAADFVNEVVERYEDYALRASRADTRREVDVLTEQVALYEGQLREAEERLRAFQEAERIVAPEEQAVVEVKRLAELQAARDGMAVERHALAALLTDVRRRPPVRGGESPYRQLATFPSFISNRAVQDYLNALVELENERGELIARRTEENVDIRAIDARIDELESQLHTLAGSYLESLGTQIASSDLALASVGSQLAQIPAKEVQYARLARDRKLLGEVYLLLQTQLKEAEVEEAIQDPGVRVVDTAIVPEKPEFPKPWINLLLGSVLGLMVGLMTVVGKEVMDPRIRSHRDAQRAIAGVPLLGLIPLGPRHAPEARNGRRIRLDRLVRFGAAPAPREDGLITVRDPWDPSAESYRALSANLASAGLTRRPSVLVVTGARPGEGKSMLAANLAISLARQGISTALVDADLRRGRLHRSFGVDRDPGLAQILTGEADLDEARRSVNAGVGGAALDLVPTGRASVHPAELLTSKRLADLVERLRGEYSVVLLDAPPLTVAADAALLGTVADAAILVARSGTTLSEDLQDSAARLRQAGVALGGVVLTGMPREDGAPAYRPDPEHEHEQEHEAQPG